MVMPMNMMEVKKGLSMKKKNKKQPYHMKHDYQRFQSVNGYKFWAKNKEDAQKYCKMMNWVIGGLVEEKE